MMQTLPDDILGVLLYKLDDISLIMLYHTDKNYHKSVAKHAITNKINRKLKCNIVAKHGHLEVLKWAIRNYQMGHEKWLLIPVG
jgi:hypothetical protein